MKIKTCAQTISMMLISAQRHIILIFKKPCKKYITASSLKNRLLMIIHPSARPQYLIVSTIFPFLFKMNMDAHNSILSS